MADRDEQGYRGRRSDADAPGDGSAAREEQLGRRSFAGRNIASTEEEQTRDHRSTRLPRPDDVEAATSQEQDRLPREASPAPGGPAAAPPRVDVTGEEEAQANDLRQQASYQARPKTEYPRRARERETGTAERAERNAGLVPDEHHLKDSEQAFERSRGDQRPREPGYLRDEKDRGR